MNDEERTPTALQPTSTETMHEILETVAPLVLKHAARLGVEAAQAKHRERLDRFVLAVATGSAAPASEDEAMALVDAALMLQAATDRIVKEG